MQIKQNLWTMGREFLGKRLLLSVYERIRGLSGKYPPILNISRTGLVHFMQLGSQSQDTLLPMSIQSFGGEESCLYGYLKLSLFNKMV